MQECTAAGEAFPAEPCEPEGMPAATICRRLVALAVSLALTLENLRSIDNLLAVRPNKLQVHEKTPSEDLLCRIGYLENLAQDLLDYSARIGAQLGGLDDRG